MNEEAVMLSTSLESIAAVRSGEAREVVVFSGAGLSADSGIPTFRDGATGLWNNVDPDEVASIEGFLRKPRVVWDWLLQLKNLVDDRHPNAGHHAIARLEEICARANG
jgi:NAD-dependent deacetylase